MLQKLAFSNRSTIDQSSDWGHAEPGSYRGEATESIPVVRDIITTEPKKGAEGYNAVKRAPSTLMALTVGRYGIYRHLQPL